MGNELTSSFGCDNLFLGFIPRRSKSEKNMLLFFKSNPNPKSSSLSSIESILDHLRILRDLDGYNSQLAVALMADSKLSGYTHWNGKRPRFLEKERWRLMVI